MKKYIIALVLSLSVLLAPAPAYAANLFLNGSESIVPGQCSSCPCGVGGALQFVQNLMNFMIALAVIFMTLFIVWAGFLFIMSATNPESRSKARSMLINAFIGLFIVLSAWLIVDFVMKQLYGGGTFGPWNQILQIDDSDGLCIVGKTPQKIDNLPVVIGAGVNGVIATPGTAGQVSGTILSDAQTRNALISGGVVIANTPANRTMANTRADTVNQTLEIKAKCGCTVQVNATTGGTHSGGVNSHANGYKVDIQITGQIDQFFKSRLNQRGSRSDGTPLYYDSCGNEYARETGRPGHWDVTVNKGVCSL